MPLTLGNNWKAAGLDSCTLLLLWVTGKHAEKEVYLCAQVIKDM